MKRKFFVYVLSIAVLCGSSFVLVSAQKSKGKTSKSTATIKTKPAETADPLLAALPLSDAVVSIDVGKLLNEFIPKILSESPDKLTKFNAELDKIKSQSGFDLRQIDKIVAGFRFVRTAPTKLNVEAVALGKSSYDANALVMGGKLIAKGRFKEEKYANKTITLFDLSGLKDKAAEAIKGVGQNEDPNRQNTQSTTPSMLDGIVNMILGQNLSEVAVVPIDDKTLAIGKLSSVKAALDTKVKSKATNVVINALAKQNVNALVWFGGNVPKDVSQLLDIEDELAVRLDSIKQVYGSIGMSETNYEIVLTARATDNVNAKKLLDIILTLKQLGGGFLQGRNDELSKMGAGLLETLKLSNVGKDVNLRIEMKQSDVNGLLKLF